MTHRTAQGFEPPGESYAPREGDVARDTRTSRVGRVMGHVEPFYYLRPLKGGVEWEVEPEYLVPARQSDAMSDELSQVNARSRGR
ncbi:hypothetical protein ACFQ61_34895 [Streptomyces sp. NPDC056500]|uniref:hypothetical protein n=1 Tax=Streptomyces sp. NPDC056500 TaxID=3345840 RepID=UPI0036B821DF